MAVPGKLLAMGIFWTHRDRRHCFVHTFDMAMHSFPTLASTSTTNVLLPLTSNIAKSNVTVLSCDLARVHGRRCTTPWIPLLNL
jgi:hypothetical protein